MQLAGIDLAWRSSKNPTALAVGWLAGRELDLEDVAKHLYGIGSILDHLQKLPSLVGIAIDGPLLITNDSGQRKCETLIGKEYGSRKASCHTSNLSLFPDADSAGLSSALCARGFNHLGGRLSKWQIERYPHPALIEVFNLAERLNYKKGQIGDRRRGQCQLADLLLGLSKSDVLRLSVPDHFSHFFKPSHIESLRGVALKHNEDVLDAVVCLYVGGLYATGISEHVFGDAVNGYIYLPQVRCI